MVRMAQEMKQYATNIKTQFHEDEPLLKNLDERMGRNISSTNKEIESVRKTTKSAVSSFMTRIFMFLIAICVFLFMIIFIRTFPNKVNQKPMIISA